MSFAAGVGHDFIGRRLFHLVRSHPDHQVDAYASATIEKDVHVWFALDTPALRSMEAARQPWTPSFERGWQPHSPGREAGMSKGFCRGVSLKGETLPAK